MNSQNTHEESDIEQKWQISSVFQSTLSNDYDVNDYNVNNELLIINYKKHLLAIHFAIIVLHFTVAGVYCEQIKNNPRWHISSTFRKRRGRLPESGRRIPGCSQIVSKRYMGTE